MSTPLPLPDFATRALDSARTLGSFLRASHFSNLAEWPLFAAGPDTAAALGLYRADAAADEGLTSWLRSQITTLHSSSDFDAHAAACRISQPGLQVPRLRHLVPALPSISDLRTDLYQTLAQSLDNMSDNTPSDQIEKVLAFYLNKTFFAEVLTGQSLTEILAGVFQTQMPAVLRVIDRTPTVAETLIRGLIGQACRHFHETRYFERAHGFARALAYPAGGGLQVDPGLLDDLWYGAFRLGRLSEAQDWLAHWARVRPLQKRPLVYRALVTAATDKAEACRLLELAGAADGRSTIPGNVLFAEYSLQQGRIHAAELAMRRACDMAQATEAGLPQDYPIALHNILSVQRQKTDALQDLFKRSDLRLEWDQFGLDSVRDLTPQTPLPHGLRVTVVMTAYNAAAHLERAVQGVLAQNLAGLKLILVDDCSQDSTPELCAALAGDNRVLHLQTPRNIGTYAAKNLGIVRALAMGCDYITLCDSDDFWLQTHVARHVAAMEANRDLQCSTSQWIRVRGDGTVECGLRGRYVETCPHSTFLRAEVFDRVGFFDEVRFGADREFLRRIAIHFGTSAVGNIPTILTLGRRHDRSLTQSGAGAVTEFNDSPPRLAYWRAWNEWHLTELSSGQLPRIEAGAETRAFPVSSEMLP